MMGSLVGEKGVENNRKDEGFLGGEGKGAQKRLNQELNDPVRAVGQGKQNLM